MFALFFCFVCPPLKETRNNTFLLLESLLVQSDLSVAALVPHLAAPISSPRRAFMGPLIESFASPPRIPTVLVPQAPRAPPRLPSSLLSPLSACLLMPSSVQCKRFLFCSGRCILVQAALYGQLRMRPGFGYLAPSAVLHLVGLPFSRPSNCFGCRPV